MIIEDLFYTEDHLWVRKEEDSERVIIGLSDYGQERLGEIISVDLLSEGEEVSRDDELATIGTASDEIVVYSPVTGKIIEINNAVVESPAIINEDPYEDGWLIKMELVAPKELDDLMDAAEYEEYVEQARIHDEEEALLAEELSEEEMEE